MEFVPLREILPDVSARETRELSVLKETYGLPVGHYIFSESFCSDKNCDRRRAFINVVCADGELQGLHIATIGYGSESLATLCLFMRKNLHCQLIFNKRSGGA